MAELKTAKQVKVIRDSGPVMATVDDPTKTPWSVIEDETRIPVEWEVVMYPPPECDERLPLIFESRDDAIAWVETHDCAKSNDWSFLRGPQDAERPESGQAQKRSHNSLVLYSDYGGGGQQYVVPSQGVEDWAARLPASANVPYWVPKSYSSTDRSDISGHENGESPGSRQLPIRRDDTDNLPFSYVHSAFTT